MWVLATNAGPTWVIAITFHFALPTGIAGVCFAFSGSESENSVCFVLADIHAEIRDGCRGQLCLAGLAFLRN